MKLLRISVFVLFLLSTAGYLGYRYYEERTKDLTGPTIIFQEDSLVVSVSAAENELFQGTQAFDDYDGDVTNSLMVEDISHLIGKEKRIVTYVAFDSNTNISKREREIIYMDYTSPRFSASKPLRFPVGEGNRMLQNLMAFDCIDGDISEKIRYEEPESNFGYSEGNYPMEFLVTNSVGDTTSLPVEVTFYHANAQNKEQIPEIRLSEYIVYIKKGDPFYPKSYINGLRLGNREYSFTDNDLGENNIELTLKNAIQIDSDLKVREPGIYSIEYTMMTEAGYTGETSLVVIVEE